jgi:TonB family protein
MTSIGAFMAACVRAWTRIYTWRLPAAVRDARRQEIESDLWESSHDPQMTRAELVVQMTMRLTLGIADDFAWRVAQVSVTRSATLRTVTAAAVPCVLLLFALSRLTADVPALPEAPMRAPHVQRTRSDRPPPPPPPPTRAGGASSEPVFQYGRTSYSIVTEGPAPVRISEVRPVYPPLAVAAGLEGHVVVRARITERGRVTDAEVAPAGMLGAAALHAVQQWEFTAQGTEAPRPALLTVRVSFERAQ